VESFDDAGIVVLNSCTVKNPSQEAFVTLLNKAKSQGKIAIAAGCVPQSEPTLKDLEDCSVIGITNIGRIAEVLEEAIKGNIVQLLEREELPKLALPKIRRNKWIEILPLSTGCLGQCTFCKTRQARGTLMSYQPEEIVNRAKQVVEEGVTELWMTSEDAGTYGRDIGKNFPELCWQVLSVLRPHNILKLGMTNPPYILEHMEEMAVLLNHPQVYSHLHIPVQTGSNKVLERMVREYVIEDFYKLCDYLLKHVPDITLATDIICGFPGETEEDFKMTLDLVKRYKFDSVYISQFYPRPGTVAAGMKKINTKIVKQRSTELTKLFESYTTYDNMLNTEHKVWITDTEINKKNIANEKQEAMIGHTKNYVKVIIREVDYNLIGKCVKVKIIETSKWHVVGEVIATDNVIEDILPAAHYRKEFQRIKVNYRAKERLGKLREELKEKHKDKGRQV
jgi:threonylcarbamoyladenosine tRNA methylthiotransferase CDKAL1